jgi:hypothetical protein
LILGRVSIGLLAFFISAECSLTNQIQTNLLYNRKKSVVINYTRKEVLDVILTMGRRARPG